MPGGDGARHESVRIGKPWTRLALERGAEQADGERRGDLAVRMAAEAVGHRHQ